LLYWVAASLLLAGVGTGSFFLVREIAGDEPDAGADLGPFWYSQALEEDAAKPRIARQTLSGILIGPDVPVPTIDVCEKDPDGASPVPTEEVDTRSTGTPVEVNPAYLPDGVYVETAEGAECEGAVVNVVKRYLVPTKKDPAGSRAPLWSGGGFVVARTLTTRPQYPVEGAAERLRAVTIAGRPAVLVDPVKPLGHDIGIAEIIIVIDDGSGMTLVQGDGLPSEEFMKFAASLYE
jgi:hypothetical protein